MTRLIQAQNLQLLACLFNHSIRHKLYDKLNPINTVRPSSVRQRDPDILTIPEIVAIIYGIRFGCNLPLQLGHVAERIWVKNQRLAHVCEEQSEDSPPRFNGMSAQISQERKTYCEILEATQKRTVGFAMANNLPGSHGLCCRAGMTIGPTVNMIPT